MKGGLRIAQVMHATTFLKPDRVRSPAGPDEFDGVLRLAHLDQPPAQLGVHRLRSHYGVGWSRPCARVEHEWKTLAASHAPVGADQLLESGHLVFLRPVGAVEHDVRTMLEAVSAPHLGGGIW